MPRIKTPKFKSLSKKDQAGSKKVFEWFASETAMRKVVGEKARKEAERKHELHVLRMSEAPKITDASMTDFKKAADLYHLQRALDRIRFIGKKKDAGILPGYEINLEAINPFRWLDKGAYGKAGVLGIVVYPVVWGFRTIVFPLSLSSRLVARLIAQKQFKNQIRDFIKQAKKHKKEKGTPMPVLMQLAHFRSLDEMNPKN